MKKQLIALALALIPSIAAAGAFEDLARASGADLKPLTMQVKDLKQMVERPMIPLKPQDVLASCDVIDAKTFRAYSLDEAANVLNGCLNQLYASDARTRRAYTVKASSGRFGVRACAEAKSDSVFTCQAFMEVEGLVITVEGTILTGDGILSNLDYSLQKRGGKILGYYATINNKAGILK